MIAALSTDSLVKQETAMKSKSTRAGLIFISLALLFLSSVLFFVAKSTFETTCEDLAAGSSIGPCVQLRSRH